ncbi:MAG TPA: hypothetical protein VNE67_04225 [Acetobacteraceae bacterium]|nr:hypothetical protein [Acetobacteraceae bacterium]
MRKIGKDQAPFGVENLTVAELLSEYGAILDELRRRRIVRSSNNPLSDYAELLFCKAFGWSREGNSTSGHDATDAAGVRYQIKGRRLTCHNPSRQMSAIRNLDAIPFDLLGGVLVDESFQIIRAALVPIAVVRERSVHQAHTNSWRFLLRDDVWKLPGVSDVTAELRAAAATI